MTDLEALKARLREMMYFPCVMPAEALPILEDISMQRYRAADAIERLEAENARLRRLWAIFARPCATVPANSLLTKLKPSGAGNDLPPMRRHRL